MTDSSLPGRRLSPIPTRAPASQLRRVLLASVVITAALWVLPGGELIGYPLLLLSTYVHEMGHGLAAELVGGNFESLRVFGDGSGVALTATSGGAFSRALVSAGGLVGPAVAAFIGFVIGRRAGWSRWFLLLGGVLVLLTSAMWVRSLVGWAVALGLTGVALGTAVAIRHDHWCQLVVVLLSVQLGLSVFSRGEYLFADTAATGAGVGLSDSAAIADALVGPYWLWGGICGIFSLAVLALGSWLLLAAARGDDDL